MPGKLTAVKVRALTTAGRYGDGKGLWLQVRDAEHRSWLFRFMLNGKARQMGLGAVEDVSLAEARETAEEARRLLRQGIDPIDHRRAGRAARAAANALTFRDSRHVDDEPVVDAFDGRADEVAERNRHRCRLN